MTPKLPFECLRPVPYFRVAFSQLVGKDSDFTSVKAFTVDDFPSCGKRLPTKTYSKSLYLRQTNKKDGLFSRQQITIYNAILAQSIPAPGIASGRAHTFQLACP